MARSYARLFPELPAFRAEESFLHALGRAGGLCDCGEPSDEPQPSGSEAAGWPFFGQFVAHDITADRSPLQPDVDPDALRNGRSPKLDLECLYGDGPVGHPFLFRRDDPAKLLTSEDGRDLQRNREGTAVIGDPRNDSHALVSQMHLAFVRAHNATVDRIRARQPADRDIFEAAARELRWTYQTALIREFLPSVIGSELTSSVLEGDRRYYRPSAPFIPLEFADAAYRYGHSQIRHQYRVNSTMPPRAIFPDLIGFRELARQNTVDWSLFFDGPSAPRAQRSKRLDGRLVPGLIALPVAITGRCLMEDHHSLAARDLQRGQGVGLPSGEAVSRRMGEPPLTADEIGVAGTGWSGETPLWFYLLREAAVRANGDRLGPIGGRIVGEVLIGLLDLDRTSVLHATSEWRCTATLFELLTEHSTSARGGCDWKN